MTRLLLLLLTSSATLLVFGLWIPLKAAMQLLGKDTGEVRLPLTPLEESQIASLRTTLANYGLL